MAFDYEKDKWDREKVTKEVNRTSTLAKAMKQKGDRAEKFQDQAKTALPNASAATLVGDFAQWAVGENQIKKADAGLAKAMAEGGRIDSIAGNLLTAKQEQDATQVFQKETKDLYKLTQRMDGVMGKLSKYAKGGELEGQEPPGISGAHLGQNGNVAFFSSGQIMAGGGIAQMLKGAVSGVGGALTSTVGQAGDVHSQGNEEAQLLKSEITGLVNDLVREQSGASATDTERRSVASSMGFNEWSDVNVILQNLNNLQGRLKSRVDGVYSGTHEQVLAGIKRRGGEKDFQPLTEWAPTALQFGNFDQTSRRAGQSNEEFTDSMGAGPRNSLDAAGGHPSAAIPRQARKLGDAVGPPLAAAGDAAAQAGAGMLPRALQFIQDAGDKAGDAGRSVMSSLEGDIERNDERKLKRAIEDQKKKTKQQEALSRYTSEQQRRLQAQGQGR
jgi:hypothetical protein